MREGNSPPLFSRLLAGCCQGRIWVDRTAMTWMKLEMEVVGPSVCVSCVPHIPDHGAAGHIRTGRESGRPAVEVREVEAGAVALEPDGDTAKAAVAETESAVGHRDDRDAAGGEHIGALVGPTARSGIPPIVGELD